MLISIIANFYRSGRFIPRLIRSISRQTFDDYELICVIDASPDDDAAVIRRCADRYGISDKTHIIVNPHNLGISRSKKVGIDAAQGDYLAFIDGDDFYEPEALQQMAIPAACHHVDFVNMNYCRYYAPLRHRVDICAPIKPEDYHRVIHREELVDKFMVNWLGTGVIINNSYWSKLYRRELIQQLRFDFPSRDETAYEDKWFNLEVFRVIRTAYFVRYVGYNWRWGGITSVRVNSTWTFRRYFEKHIEHFAHQCEVINELGYNKGWMPLLLNLKTMFVDAISNEAVHPLSSARSGDTRRYIAQCLGYEPMSHLRELSGRVPADEQPLIDAIVANDVDAVYAYMHGVHRRGWRVRLVQRLFHTLFYPFR